MYATVNTFTDWLVAEMEERDWTQAELSRRAGVSRAAISDILSGRRNIGKDLALNIAKALKVPPERVFIAAGILKDEQERSAEIDKIVAEAEDMSREEQLELLAYIRFRNNQKKKK